MGRAKEEAPKAYSLRLTESALQDLDNITGYIAYIKHQPLNAIRVGDEIIKTDFQTFRLTIRQAPFP